MVGALALVVFLKILGWVGLGVEILPSTRDFTAWLWASAVRTKATTEQTCVMAEFMNLKLYIKAELPGREYGALIWAIARFLLVYVFEVCALGSYMVAPCLLPLFALPTPNS